MRPPLVAIALSVTALAVLAPRAAAAPVEARVGVAGLPPFVSLAEAELKWPALPIRLGGSAYYVLDNYAQATGWIGLEVPLGPSVTIGGFGGLNLDGNQLRVVAADPQAPTARPLIPGQVGYLLGAYYRQDWDRLWLKIAPSVSLIPLPPLAPRPDQPEAGYLYRFPEVNLWRSLLLGGPPWLEVGYKVTPNLHVSLQANWLSFLKVSWSL